MGKKNKKNLNNDDEFGGLNTEKDFSKNYVSHAATVKKEMAEEAATMKGQGKNTNFDSDEEIKVNKKNKKKGG